MLAKSLLAGTFMLLSALVGSARGFQEPLTIPPMNNWTVQQCMAYWAHADRDVTLLVNTAELPTAHSPAGVELQHAKYLVDKVDGGATSVPVGGTVTVLLKNTPEGALKSKKRSFTKDGKLRLDYVNGLYTEKYSFRYSHSGEAEGLNPYNAEDASHHVLHYQSPWAGSDPIYEGGTVGVVINGPVGIMDVIRTYWHLLLAAALIALGAGYGLKAFGVANSKAVADKRSAGPG